MKRVTETIPGQTRPKLRSLSLAIFLAFAVLVPSRASAQTYLPEQQCVSSFLAACATLQYIDFDDTWATNKGTLRLVVSNTSYAGEEPNAYISQLVLNLVNPTGALPDFPGKVVVYYGDFSIDGFTPTSRKIKLDVNEDTPGELRVALSAYPGTTAVMIEVEFEDLLTGVEMGCAEGVNCDPWSVEMRGLGEDELGVGSTATPEPATFIMMATGLLGLAGAGAVRRRRGNTPGE